jgi:hypothetical protein
MRGMNGKSRMSCRYLIRLHTMPVRGAFVGTQRADPIHDTEQATEDLFQVIVS